MFAKIYETDLGQVLVKKDTNDDNSNPEIRFYFEPKGLGVCNIALSMKDDSEESWVAMDKLFDRATKEKAYDMVKNAIDELQLSGLQG